VAIDPGKPFAKEVAVPAGIDEHDLVASISAEGKELVSYSPIRLEKKSMPAVVTPPPVPQDIKTDEELYLTACASSSSTTHAPCRIVLDEALRRDPGDIRVNTCWASTASRRPLRRGRKHLRKAIERLTDSTRPKDGEASTIWPGA